MIVDEQECKLCRVTLADKKNSHIVPKFLTKSLYPATRHKKTLAIKKDGSSSEPQDTPKEDFILCTSCEKRIEIVETLFAPHIRSIHSHKTLPHKFDRIIQGQREYLICKEIDYKLFRLFFYSIVWRLSISRLDAYRGFKLSESDEEMLREVLDSNLSSTQRSLLQKLPHITAMPEYHICVVKPRVKTNPPGGILSAMSSGGKNHLVMLVDFAVFFITADEMHPALLSLSNKYSTTVIIGLGDNDQWVELNRTLVHKMLSGHYK